MTHPTSSKPRRSLVIDTRAVMTTGTSKLTRNITIPILENVKIRPVFRIPLQTEIIVDLRDTDEPEPSPADVYDIILAGGQV